MQYYEQLLRSNGGAVQVDPFKRTLKPPGTKRLRLQYDELVSSVAFNFNMRRYTTGYTTTRGAAGITRSRTSTRSRTGRAVQVKPMKPILKAPGTKRLKLKYGGLLSNFAFNFYLRRYTLDAREAPLATDRGHDSA